MKRKLFILFIFEILKALKNLNFNSLKISFNLLIANWYTQNHLHFLGTFSIGNPFIHSGLCPTVICVSEFT